MTTPNCHIPDSCVPKLPAPAGDALSIVLMHQDMILLAVVQLSNAVRLAMRKPRGISRVGLFKNLCHMAEAEHCQLWR